jgi:hypothetical protein
MTISDGYRRQQQKLHENANYGVASLHFAPLVAEVYKQGQCRSISDYGAGKRRLLEGLEKQGLRPTEYLPYDPAFPDYGPPSKADLVVCIDVLEHVEPEHIDNVLLDLKEIVTKYGVFTVHSGPATKQLDDGRNAHLTQQSASWWLPKICEHFEPIQFGLHELMGNGFWIIVKPKS